MFQNKYILIRNLAMIFVVCNMLYWIFPFPPVVWRVGLVLLSLYVIVFERRTKTSIEKAVIAFACFNLLHFFISYLWLTPSTTQIGNILCALLPLSLFACLAEKGVMTEKFFSWTGALLVISAIIHYYNAQDFLLERLMLDSDADVTNNASSAFLMLVPMLFLFRRSVERWIILLVCIFFLLMSAKRGNIIAAIIPSALFVYNELKDSKKSVLKIVIVLAALIVASFMIYRWFVTNEYLMYRVEKTMEGNSSGRDVIYVNAWNTWLSSDSIIHYLLGYGFDGTIRSSLMHGMHAHNDWLEILVDYGLVGIFSYLLIFISFAVLIVRTKDLQTKMVLLSAVFIWFSKTLYSMGFTEGDMALLMISLGTAVGTEPNKLFLEK